MTHPLHRIGILGAGPNGTGNAKYLSTNTNRCRIAAVADPNLDAAKALASKHQGAAAFDGLAAMLPLVDAVVISSPNWLHAEQAIACAKAGKHVFIEKPMALSVAEADAVVDAVEGAGVASMVGFSVRFSPLHQELARRVRAGGTDDIVSVWSRRLCYLELGGPQSWRADFEKSGGVMSELLTHEIDWMVDLLGLPESVFCRIHSHYGGHERMNDHVWLTMNYPGGKTATIEGGQRSVVPDFSSGVLGREEGWFTTDWGRKLHYKNNSGEGEEISLEGVSPFDKAEHWLDVIDGRCDSVAGAAYGRTITRLIECALDSAVTGKVVAL